MNTNNIKDLLKEYLLGYFLSEREMSLARTAVVLGLVDYTDIAAHLRRKFPNEEFTAEFTQFARAEFRPKYCTIASLRDLVITLDIPDKIKDQVLTLLSKIMCMRDTHDSYPAPVVCVGRYSVFREWWSSQYDPVHDASLCIHNDIIAVTWLSMTPQARNKYSLTATQEELFKEK